MVFKAKQNGFNKTSLVWVLAVLLMPVVAFWHSWLWYFNRVNSSLEEAVGIFIVLAFLLFLSLKCIVRNNRYYQFSLFPLCLLLVLYGLTFFWEIPSIIRAALAFTTVLLVIYWSAFGRYPPAAFWALVSLSLPVVPSLQFYLGYPARYISASLTVPLLNLNGLSVSQKGTYLIWNEQMLQFDAPCSGVTMWWAGLLLALFISFVYQFNYWKTIFAITVATLFVLVGNVLRASSLFYIESEKFLIAPSWIHEGVGVASFLAIAVGIFITLDRFKDWDLLRGNK